MNAYYRLPFGPLEEPLPPLPVPPSPFPPMPQPPEGPIWAVDEGKQADARLVAQAERSLLAWWADDEPLAIPCEEES